MVLLGGGHHVIAAGTMKTTYWLVTIAAVAAVGVTVYARFLPNDSQAPTVPLATDATAKDVPRLTLPPVVIPPDEPLALPDVPGKPTTSAPMPISVITPVSASEPVVTVPQVPTTDIPPPPVPPASIPLPKSSDPIPPLVPTPMTKSDVGRLPSPVPPKEIPGPAMVIQPPVAPTPLTPPSRSAVGSDAPPVLPEPVAVAGKYVILKGDKLIEGSSVSLRGEVVVVRQGILDRPFHKSDVQFVAENKDEVYKFMLAKVSTKDAAARLKVARWCMFSGMREQALAEAREIQRIEPNNTSAADMIRSLELSLQQFPAASAPKMIAPVAPTFPVELKSTPAPAPIPPANDPDPDVTPESALVFASRVQPFLANQCVSCHASPEYAGKFKLARITATEAGPQATRTNLRAVAGQLRKDDPAASPLLVKTRIAHGGMQRPAVEGTHVIAYQTLESWVALAVGTPIVAPATVPTPTPSAPIPTMPIEPPPPSVPLTPAIEPVRPPMPPAEVPLPPAGTSVVVPPTPSVPTPPPLPVPPVRPLPTPPSDPAITPYPPPVVPPPVVPVAPPAPMSPQTIPLPPPSSSKNPLPIPPSSPPRAQPLPPIPPAIPPADSGKYPGTAPMIPTIPPASAAPKPTSPVLPTSGSQFGVATPPKVPTTGPSGGDEFDPEGFNQQGLPK